MRSWLTKQVIEDFKWYYDKGYITARDGNACYLDGDHYVVTASGSEKHRMTERDFAFVSLDQKKIESYDNRKPSIETGAHIAALKQSGKEFSVHVHSPNTVALAALFEPFGGFRPQTRHLVEVLNSKWPELFRYTKVGHIVPFLEPGSKKLHESIEAALEYWTEEAVYDPNDPAEIVGMEDVKKFNDIVILQRHGVLTIGDSFDECMEHIVRLEHISNILLKIVTASGSLESIL